MKLRSIALVLSVALASAAYAQTGVYITGDAQQFTQEGVLAIPGTHSNVDRPWLYGPAFGIYYDFTRVPGLGVLKKSPIVLGVDARGDIFRLKDFGSQFDREDFIFSLRLATKKPLTEKYLLKSTPYLQGGFGVGHTRNPFRTTYNNDFIYQVSIGADRPLHGKFKKFDWRVIEASAGSLANYPTGYYSYNGGHGAGQSNYLITVGTGLVFRLH
ncbi:MAG: hypothetical protein ABSF57_09980 [Acidobacteriaceae bacterium]|jgi:hypothetical protein